MPAEVAPPQTMPMLVAAMATTDRLIARILDDPHLVEVVHSADAETFCSLLDEVGLADSGELLALATPQQFVAAIDASLWDWEGDAESFNHLRFVTWLEVMFEGGENLVMRRLLQLPEETLVLAFLGQLFVLDVQTLGAGMAGASRHEAELAERVLDACLYIEFGDHVLVARRPSGWDTVLAALLTLDRDHHDVVQRVLDACCRASTDQIEQAGGLQSLLSSAETIAEDARAEKNDRRAKRGYVAPDDATAFLALAAATPTDLIPADTDAITRAYQREFEPRPPEPPAHGRGLRDLLGRDPPKLPARALRRTLDELDATTRDERQAELAYLANLLLASGTVDGPAEAATLVLEVVHAGLEHARGLEPDLDVATVGADRLFRLGWALRGHAALTPD